MKFSGNKVITELKNYTQIELYAISLDVSIKRNHSKIMNPTEVVITKSKRKRKGKTGNLKNFQMDIHKIGVDGNVLKTRINYNESMLFFSTKEEAQLEFDKMKNKALKKLYPLRTWVDKIFVNNIISRLEKL